MSSADLETPFDELLAHADWVRGLARRLVLDAARADDLVQETWVVALERPPSHADNLRAWLGSVVTSLAKSGWRSDARRGRRDPLCRRARRVLRHLHARRVRRRRGLLRALHAQDQPRERRCPCRPRPRSSSA